MPCLDTAEPYYLSQRRGDPEFKRYLKVVMRYASYIYPDSDSDPVAVLDELVARYGVLIPSVGFSTCLQLTSLVFVTGTGVLSFTGLRKTIPFS